MSDFEKDLVYSESIKAGKRIYYFDVKKTRTGELYLSVTESKKVGDAVNDNSRASYEKHKLFLYREDYDKFTNAMLKALQFAKENDHTPRFKRHKPEGAEENTADNGAEAKEAPLNVDLDF